MPGWFEWWGDGTPQEPVASSPSVARKYCPGCEPFTDPIQECVVVDYCGNHIPSMRGDITLDWTGQIEYNEAGGSSNRAACAFIHRSRLTDQLEYIEPPATWTVYEGVDRSKETPHA